MRERTPSVDDTLVRAPPTLSTLPTTPPALPAPPHTSSPETTDSVSKVIVDPEVILADITIAPVTSVNSNNNKKKMVASSHSLEELGVTHPTSASGDRGGLHETNRTAQTALDKRSRLSNVINNLRKKVPETPQPRQQQQQQQQEKQEKLKVDNDGRNSVERNLENLEKYVMTVLNGVINDEADQIDKNITEEHCKNRILSSSTNEENSTSNNIEASLPEIQGNKIEDEEWQSVVTVDDSQSEGARAADKNADEALEGAKNIVEDINSSQVFDNVAFSNDHEERSTDTKETNLEDVSVEKITICDQQRPLCDNRTTEDSESINSQANLMDVCRELMSDLLNDINQLMEERSRDLETPEIRVSCSPGETSLHCSLPLDKVAPILRSCSSNSNSSNSSSSSSENQTITSSSSPQRSPSRPSPPTIRHLCLYCDRKFLSISLRQRHAERVHQVGGGSRRSERNSRRTIQNCQYCSEKVNTDISNDGSCDTSETNLESLDNLDSLFRHMAKTHSDKYYACVQCSTRYATRENLANHLTEVHGSGTQDNINKESTKDRNSPVLIREQVEIKIEDDNTTKKDNFTNPGSPEFDSSFYSSVSCNIRDNLLHHLDGKLQTNAERTILSNTENKPPPPSQQQQQQQQNFYETNATQIQLPIDISLTAATPVYTNSKEYSNDGNENSSEYAQRPGKTRTHPRRVSFEKYNFPRKYDGKEPWSCSIKDLSKFDILTQLTLRKKQQLTKALINNTTLNRLCGSQSGSNEQITNAGSTMRQSGLTEINLGTASTGEENELGNVHDALGTANVPSEDSSETNLPRCTDLVINECKSKSTIFTTEFASFIELKRRDDYVTNSNNLPDVVYAELTGEWSRPRIYVCGACADRHVTLKEMEEHKACAHPNVWCSHFEFAGDQRDLYKYLFLPGKGPPTAKARAAISPEKICTKCSRNCNTLAELHRHMLECGGDQTWLLGLFGNGKKKCKWRPFGSRSRRRRQRGMKRNIQNSQTPRANTPKERPTNGPRVRPSDRESIQKMLANLPPKRASRKVLREENLARSREAAQTVQTRSRPRMSTDVSSSAVQSRNKTVLKNKLLKNAKSFQRNRTRIDNITAAIESVVNRRFEHSSNENKTESKRNNESTLTRTNKIGNKNFLSVLSKKKNVKTKDSTIVNIEHPRTRGRPFGGIRVSNRSKVKGASLSANLPRKNSLKGSVGRPVNSVDGKNSHNHQQQQQQSKEKNLKESGEPEESGEKSPRSNNAKTKKKKLVDPVASLNASIKAKQQLRTNDGKFARNPNKRENRSLKIVPDRYPRRHINTAEFLPKSRIKATRDFTKNQITTKSGKRVGRISADSTKMPTLEPAVPVKNVDSETDVDTDKIRKGNELPVLSPIAVGTERKTQRNTTILQESRQDAVKKNPSGDILDLDDVLKKSIIDVAEIRDRFKRENLMQGKAETDKKRNKGTRGKRTTVGVAPPSPVTSSASSPTLSVSSSCSSSISSVSSKVKERSRSQRILPRRRNVNVNDQDKQSMVNGKLIDTSNKKDLMTRLGLQVSEQKPRRSSRTSLSKDREDEVYTSQDELSASKKNREKITDFDEDLVTPKIGRLRKSPRNLALKNVTKSLPQATKSKDSLNIEKPTEEDPHASSDVEKPPLQVHLDVEDDFGEEPEDDPEEVRSGLPKRGRGLGKRRGRIKAVESNNSDIIKTKDEETVESIANLSLEHLQHESSNSNVDSGKENSSETPVMLPKPRAVRPRKTKNGRLGHDRTAKRTLGSVIGILTEGVNIPVEIQQSVVLTVQTTSVGTETITSNENESRCEGEHRNDDSVEENKISDHNNENSKNPDAIRKPETQCSSNANETTEPEVNPDEPAVPDVAMRSEESNFKKQDIQEEVPSNSSAVRSLIPDEIRNFDPLPAAGNSNPDEIPTCDKPQVAVEPSNDIIMDLSKRKPKGKGSFLEKIVSKIAKQKDVLLGEGDVGSLLDNAVEDLTNILDEVAPNLTESTQNLTISNNEAQIQEDEVAGINCAAENVTELSSNTEAAVLQAQNETVDLKLGDEAGPTSDENQFIAISATENSVDSEIKVNEDLTNSKKRAFETNSPKKNKRKSVDTEAIPALEDIGAEEVCLADIMKLIQNPKTNGEKKNTTARPGKRKPETEIDQAILKEQFKDDESDSQYGPQNASTEDCDLKRPKRRSMKKNSTVEENLPLTENITEARKNRETIPKKITKRKTLPDEDPEASESDIDQSQIPSSAGNRSAKRRSTLRDQKNVEDPVALSPASKPASGRTSKLSIQEKEILPERQVRSSKRKSSLASDNTKNNIDDNVVNSNIEICNQDLGSRAKNIKRLTNDSSNLEESLETLKTSNVIGSSERKSVTKKRKSVTEAAKSEDESSSEIKSKFVAKTEESKKLKTTIVTDDSNTIKRRTSRKSSSLVDEHLDLDSNDSKNTFKSENAINSKIQSKIESTEAVDRLRTLRRRNSKRKSLAEDHLELFENHEEEEILNESFKVPEINDLHYSRTRRSSKRSLTLSESEKLDNSKDQIDTFKDTDTSIESLGTEERSESASEESMNSETQSTPVFQKITTETGKNLEMSLIDEHLDLSDENNEDQVTSDLAEQNVEQTECIIATADINSTPEITTEDDQQQQIQKKRGSGNFAVGHTKTGEILIVEKKKKLTKEAARFFCEVCLTSFTRKSSLKKHNSSQSHLTQVAKSGKVTEIDTSQLRNYNEKEELNQDFWGSEDSLEPLDETLENIAQTDHFALRSETNHISKKSLTSQISEEEALEEELLDEEICKITENMTHDDFVLTDHISPELPVDTITDETKNSKKSDIVKSVKKTDTPQLKKRNLAEEHLDLDSPCPEEHKNTDKILTLEFKSSSTPVKIDPSYQKIPCNHDIELFKPNLNLKMSISKTETVHAAEEPKLASSRLMDVLHPEKLQKINDIPLPKSPDGAMHIVSIPVTIQRDVLIPSDESSSNRPLAEVLIKTSITKSRNSLCFNNLAEKESNPGAQALRESPSLIRLDFKNIAEKLKNPNEKSQPNTAEFESDDNSMDTRISVDIRKLLDDPEMSNDNYGIKSDNDHQETNLSIEDKDEFGKHSRKKTSRDTKSNKHSGKKHSRKSKSIKPQQRPSHLVESDSSDEENSNVDAMSESRNKNKIVKSVFGRVFGGEKIEKVEKIQDKVKEVLEDWDSRSEDDARGQHTPSSSPAMLSSPGTKRTSRPKKRQNRSKPKPKDDKERLSIITTESRSRRSKKQAEERISITFKEESTSAHKENNYSEDEYEQENELPVVSDHLKTIESRSSSKTDDTRKIDDEWAVFSRGIQRHDKPNLKRSSIAINHSNVVSEAKQHTMLQIPLPPWPSALPSSPSPSSPGQSSIARSSVRNRSPTPDRNSQSSGVSDSEDDSPQGRLSPVFVRNLPDTSMDSLNSSNDAADVFSDEDDKKLPLEVSYPISKRLDQDPKVVTIAPNDAVEDNALDVPRPPLLQNIPQKPRQAKVLNFDEELFVECCSRLKATTENELRGAKKIEIDHSDGYHKRDGVDSVGFRNIRDRWRDVESQNSLGSLLESVNQLLGEEMYANNEKEYSKHATGDLRSENSSRSGSPDLEVSRPPDNLGYEDSLDVAFEHNNKLRDKIQQRMRASENLITSSFACETTAPTRHSYEDRNSHRIHGIPNIPMNESRNTPVSEAATFEDQHQLRKNNPPDSTGYKHKMTSTLGGLLDKLALSNLLHNSAKHDHNGSTPMKVLAELACARAPTTAPSDLNPDIISTVQIKQKDFPTRKIRNPIKELFERKKELNDRNQPEKTRAVAVAVAALKELNVQRQHKITKKAKRRDQDFPLIRKSPYIGMAERKKRKDILFEKNDIDVIRNDKVKDVYDFDDEESQAAVTMPSVVSFRSKIMPGEPDLVSLASKTIVETLENGKEADILGRRLESMINRKFKEVEKSAPKTKGALKAFQNDQSNSKELSDTDTRQDSIKNSQDVGHEAIVGPMDDFVQRKQQQHHKRNTEIIKRSKSKKRSKTYKKKSRAAAWYENDSSDEFRTAAKTEDIGVGISKSQRTCSKGKQNLFAELSSTSSESEIENDDHSDYGNKRGMVKRDTVGTNNVEFRNDSLAEKRDEIDVEPNEEKKLRKYSETKKSESEMSDHPLIIDERRDSDEDSNTRNNYEPSFEMDDLYREDSSDEGDTECPREDGGEKIDENNTEGVLPKKKFLKDNELIPLEEALDLLDPPEALHEENENQNELLNDQENEEETRPLRNKEFEDYSCVEKTHDENELDDLPEKLSSNEKPDKVSDNLPLHIFLSRKVQESKKRKQQHLKKLQEEQERILLELQPTRRQRKCAIGKQGLLAEISSSEEDSYDGGKKFQDKEKCSSPDKPRRQKRESREKRKERYIEKKHEQIIAKEQKAIEEEILRELGKNSPSDVVDKSLQISYEQENNKTGEKISPKKPKKQKPKKTVSTEPDSFSKVTPGSESENTETTTSKTCDLPPKQKKQSKTEPKSPKKSSNNRTKKHSESNNKETKDGKERKTSVMKRDSTDEELHTTKSWNKVEEGVGVAIGRRKRAAANQLYYWSSSSDEEEEIVEESLPNVEEEDDRQEQHGWIVGDSHKRMITMLAMEKQLKEKRRRSEDEFEPTKAKNKKHRNSTS